VVLRGVGKYAGTWIGCRLAREDPKITSCLPYLLFPQAAVAAAEAVYASTLLGKPSSAAVVMPAIVIFEIFGVIMSDRALRRWRSWVVGEDRAMRAGGPDPAASSAVRRLLSVLSPEAVVLDMAAPTRDAVIKALVTHAATLADAPLNQEEAVQLILERERLMPTGMGHGIAIPHCRLLSLDRPIVVVARHAEGIVFGGVDEQPCRLLVLILSGAGDPDEHVRLLAGMSQLLGNASTREALLAAPTVDRFLDIVENVETAER
jgi:mannitol/fructose-specific phosphotransferase system IIA component (Ntr-type)